MQYKVCEGAEKRKLAPADTVLICHHKIGPKLEWACRAIRALSLASH